MFLVERCLEKFDSENHKVYSKNSNRRPDQKQVRSTITHVNVGLFSRNLTQALLQQFLPSVQEQADLSKKNLLLFTKNFFSTFLFFHFFPALLSTAINAETNKPFRKTHKKCAKKNNELFFLKIGLSYES